MTAKARKVTVIKAKKDLPTKRNQSKIAKRNVAAYARVSTDSDEQLNSYEAQISYYREFIRKHADWEFVEVYTDEGISGLNAAKREGFQRMIQDAINGQIDLIVTKSVSRFARNTVDTLTTVRLLKEHNVEVWFEKEGIQTLDSKGELLITIMSSLAQEESRSISENVSWGIRKQFADGKVVMPYKNFLGYKKGENGLPEIVPEEAEIVRYIFRKFMEGETPHRVAGMLENKGILSPTRKSKWHDKSIRSILTNEKYRGSALLQKRYTVDFLTRKQKEYNGEVPQYYIEHSHSPIIKPEEFDLVQAELKRRKSLPMNYNNTTPYSSMIICRDCGHYYGSKTWHSTSTYRRTVWQCNHKFKNGDKCRTVHLYQAEIQEAFIEAFSLLLEDKRKQIADCRIVKSKLMNLTVEEEKLKEISQEMEVVEELMKRIVYSDGRMVFRFRDGSEIETKAPKRRRVKI